MAFTDKFQFEFFTTNDDQIHEILTELKAIGCCIWCSVRILGEKRCPSYNKSIRDELQNELFSSGKSQGICPACLGILDKYTQTNFLQEICEKVKAADYEFVDYICSLNVPVSTIVRQHSVFLHLKEKFPDVYGKIPEDEISSVKDVWKWLCGPELSSHVKFPFNPKSSFEIAIFFDYADSEKECNFLISTNPNEFQRRKKSSYDIFTRAAVLKSVASLPDNLFKKYYQCPCLAPVKETTYRIECNYDAIFIAGRYNKYSRTLSQTPWVIDGKRKTVSSVEEEISNCLKTFQASEFRFSSSGREDVDVRMLGNGRPFIVEIINSRRNSEVENLCAIQKNINATSDVVKVRDLQLVSREDTLKLKEGQEEKNKCYLALCWSSEILTEKQKDLINSHKNLEVHQKTPLRVLHRRSQAVRLKIVHSMKVEAVKGNYFKLNIATQAGTYIKEFVHGDFNRTQPNLATMLNVECDILTLDVSGVELNWPPRLDDIPNDMN